MDATARAVRAAADAAAVATAVGVDTAPPGGDDADTTTSLTHQLTVLVGEEGAAAAVAWLASAPSRPPPPPLTLPSPADKAARGAVHAWFRGAAASLAPGVAVDTATTGDGITASVRGGGGGGASGRGRGRDTKRRRGDDDATTTPTPRRWSDRAAECAGGRERPYCHFSLRKINWDSASALAALARTAGLNPSSFSVAGTKDKRAVTCQRVSAWGVDAARVAKAAGRLQDVAVSDFAFERTPLRLGGAAGNRFTLVLRRVAAEDAGEVVAGVDGLQR